MGDRGDVDYCGLCVAAICGKCGLDLVGGGAVKIDKFS